MRSVRCSKRSGSSIRGPLYGAQVTSDLLELDGSSSSTKCKTITIRTDQLAGRGFSLDSAPPEKEYIHFGRLVSVHFGNSWWRFAVTKVGEFYLRVGASTIDFVPDPEAEDRTVQYWILHYMVPALQLLEGDFHFVLHGASVVVDSDAVAFIGPSGAGKSTLADHFLRQGHSFVTDDHLCIRREHVFMAIPTAPFNRPYRRIEDLGNYVERFEREPIPLRQIFLVETTDGDSAVAPIAEAQAIWILLNQRQFFLPGQMKQYFRFVSQLASAVPVSRLLVPRGLSRLPEAHARVLEKLQGIHDGSL